MTTLQRESIYEFYVNKSIFITGSTGFVGKVLLEKILRSLPMIDRVYIMIRPKKGETVEERLGNLLNSQIFDIVRHRDVWRGIGEKVIAVNGDLLLEGLGLSEADRGMLVDRVNIVFHSAATVRFDEPLKLAVEMNMMGTQKVLDLCGEMKNLVSLVHVSTAYCNCTLTEIEEVVYPPFVKPQLILDIVQWMDDEMINKISSSIIKNHPNTYTFTKQLGETLVNEWVRKNEVPTAIVRPSIITCSRKEPYEGFIDNFNGPSRLIVASHKGLLRKMYGNKNAIADFIPVDIVVNLLLVTGHEVSVRARKIKEVFNNSNDQSLADSTLNLTPRVYNCTSGQLKSMTWAQFMLNMQDACKKYPMNDPIRVPKVSFTNNAWLYHFSGFIDHRLFSLCMDLWMYVSGQKAVFYRIGQGIVKSTTSLSYFTRRQWVFHNREMMTLLHGLPEEEKNDFDFDVRKINWTEYTTNYWLGLKKFALKEDIAQIDKAKKQVKRLQQIGFLVNATLFLFLWRLFVKNFAFIGNIWKIMLQLALKIFSKIPNLAK